MKPSDYLKRGWCQKKYAIDADKHHLWGNEKEACAWCWQGAIHAACYGCSDIAERLVEAAIKIIGPPRRSPITWQDEPGRTQQEVIDLMLQAEAECGL